MKRFTIYLFLILVVLIACKQGDQESIEGVSQQATTDKPENTEDAPSSTPTIDLSLTPINIVSPAPSTPVSTTLYTAESSPTPQSYDTLIAFTAWVMPEFRHIFAMGSDGAALTELTSSNLNFDGAKWSPDGKRILYQASAGGPVSEDIWLMNADGTEQFNLTNDFMYNTSPDWSPDGESIVFSSERDGNEEIYIINTDGSNRLRLTENDASDSHSTWSPDGQKIAFISNRDGIEQLYTINPDGSELTHLVQSTDETRAPAWSPDSQSIAFGMGKAAWIVRTDGSMLRKVSGEIEVFMFGLKWSPSGRYLVFTGRDPLDTHDNVYLLDVTSGELTRLTDDRFSYSGGSWSPDETRVVLHGGAYLAKYDLFVGNIRSLEMTRLTNNESLDCCPDWQPLSPDINENK